MKENGYKYVDLDLPSGTMWATCNVGADKSEDPGLLFQFGRVDGYRYGDKNHKFKTNVQNLEDTGNEFIPKTVSGKTYKENEILDLEDDAANINMRGKWRMPTKDELKELFNNTTHKVETLNGVKGMMFTSNINGHQLFIPFTQGYWYDGTWFNFNSERSYAFVWSSQVLPSNVNIACGFDCYSSGYAYITYDTRSFTFSVRGVFRK